MVTNSRQLDSVFGALSDATRRAILAELAHGERTVGELAEPFEISRPAISKHLRVLERAGLVRGEKIGPQVHYVLVPDRLQECVTVIEGIIPKIETEVSPTWSAMPPVSRD